jgi:hypothetical protein
MLFLDPTPIVFRLKIFTITDISADIFITIVGFEFFLQICMIVLKTALQKGTQKADFCYLRKEH